MTSNKQHILVTGAGGQLGHALRLQANRFPEFEFTFWDRKELDITVESWVEERITKLHPNVVVNAAAYTNVERAEEDHEGAQAGNSLGPTFLARACKSIEALLIHISTDYVFDGNSNKPYNEEDKPNPINYYGESKLDGERGIDATFDHYYILRTSWLYDSYGHNFFNTMIRLAKERGELNVVNDQFATPTYAGVLASDILTLLKQKYVNQMAIPCGLYHYTHEGIASWFDFAEAIVKETGLAVPVKPVDSARFPTKAKRPHFSKLDITKWKEATGIEPLAWNEALHQCVSIMGNR